MYKFFKSGLDLTIFTALSFFNNQATQQFLIAVAGAVGVAFANCILLPLLKKGFDFVKTKIKNNDLIPDELEDKLIEGIDKVKEEVVEKITEEINKKK